MKLLIDANILLDVLQAHKPYLKDSSCERFCTKRESDGIYSG